MSTKNLSINWDAKATSASFTVKDCVNTPFSLIKKIDAAKTKSGNAFFVFEVDGDEHRSPYMISEGDLVSAGLRDVCDPEQAEAGLAVLLPNAKITAQGGQLKFTLA